MFFSDSPGPTAQRALAYLRPSIFWLEDPGRPAATAALAQDVTCDLLVVGGGFSGLWTALLAKQADPTRNVVLLEADRIADGATGRNGGFMSPSLTHGILNGANRWPDDLRALVRMGQENLDAIEATISALGINCDFRRAGEMAVAVQEHQIDELRETAEIANAHGDHVRILAESEIRSVIHSDSYLGGIADPDVALVNPAALAWGLLRACQDLGVRVYEHSPVRDLNHARKRVIAMTDHASITARHVAVATNAYPSIVKKMAKYVVPVYDYVLVTEPLTDEQWDAIGWEGREGLSDAGNQFHYYRPTADGRILWGGYDAVYHRNDGVNAKFDFDEEAFGRLAEHFFQTFPQLAGLSFTHGWGGAIDTCSRFSPFWGLDHAGKTAYVAGYTGLGVGASRFGAQVMLDLLAGTVNERTQLEMVKTKPIPFPPEPLRSLGINWTTKSMQSADRHEGRRNLWLKALDKVGLGFDS